MTKIYLERFIIASMDGICEVQQSAITEPCMWDIWV